MVGFPAARIGDPVTHDLLVPSGLIGPPPVPPTLPPVVIEILPAAYVTCTAVCTGAISAGLAHPPPPGPPPPILIGSPTVLINGLPAARWTLSGDVAACTAQLGDPKLVPTRKVLIGSFGAPATATPRPGEDPRVTGIRIILSGSPTGRQALEIFDRYNVGVQFASGTGSFFDGASNTITLDTSEGSMDQALTFVHEMGHAEYHHEGRTADINALGRQDYIDGMLDEEVDGTVRSIEAERELREAGYDTGGAQFPLQSDYHQAYNQAVTNTQAANAGATPEQLNAAGRQAGRQRVEDGFRNGEVVTSNTNAPYPDYYGDAWDGAHPGGP